MITSAELPLNGRGAVYHLDLCPDELADIVITVGDPARVAQVSQHFDTIEVKRAHREFLTHTGYIGKQRISVLSTGIGVPNIDIVMHELDALVNIDLSTRRPHEQTRPLTIIRLGTSGGLQASCTPGDIFISRYGIGLDNLLDYYQRTPSSFLGLMHDAFSAHLAGESGPFYLAESNHSLVQQFSPLGAVGITATCGGFYGPQGRTLRTPLRYPHLLDKLTSFIFSEMRVINFEMETAAILGLGELLGHRCVSLSVVVANRATGEFIGDIKTSVERFLVKALQQICALPTMEGVAV